MLPQEHDRNPVNSEDRESSFTERRSFKRTLSGGARESRMAELDDIQRSMEHEDPQFQRYKPRDHYDKDTENTSTHRDSPFNQNSRTQDPHCPSPTTTEASFINSAGTGERIISHEWTFEEQFKQVK